MLSLLGSRTEKRKKGRKANTPASSALEQVRPWLVGTGYAAGAAGAGYVFLTQPLTPMSDAELTIEGTKCTDVYVWIEAKVACVAKGGATSEYKIKESSHEFPLAYDGITMLRALVNGNAFRDDTYVLCALWHHLRSHNIAQVQVAFADFLSFCRTQVHKEKRVCHVFIPTSRLATIFKGPYTNFPRAGKEGMGDQRALYVTLSTPLSPKFTDMVSAFMWCRPHDAGAWGGGVNHEKGFQFESRFTRMHINLLLNHAFANDDAESSAASETQLHQPAMISVLQYMRGRMPAPDSDAGMSGTTVVTFKTADGKIPDTHKLDFSGATQRFHFDSRMLVFFPTLLLVELFLWEYKRYAVAANVLAVEGYYEIVDDEAATNFRQYHFNKQEPIYIAYNVPSPAT